jgi:hypothetical protein
MVFHIGRVTSIGETTPGLIAQLENEPGDYIFARHLVFQLNI